MAQFGFKITIDNTDIPLNAVDDVVASVLVQNGIEGFFRTMGVAYWKGEPSPVRFIIWEQEAPRMIGLAHVRRIGEDIGKLLNARFVSVQANEVQFAEIV